jgi:hypothetical protein
MALALRAAAAFAFAILQTQSGSPAMKPRAPRNDDKFSNRVTRLAEIRRQSG